MANEASKTKLLHGDKFLPYLTGSGIDIGCGADPILQSARAFDQIHGDANQISKYIPEKFDYIFSSHSLEHMLDPLLALEDWLKILKPAGYLVVLVPDEDLYEQGNFPSRFNRDHKHTFTIQKSKSWSPKSHNILELVKKLNVELIMIELQEDNYDRGLYIHKATPWNIFMGKLCGKLRSVFRTPRGQVFICKVMNFLGATIDQTSLPQRLAQIMFIVKKKL
ncbi:MAG TPA: methyltransferase domain-containing protein [Pseudobdellovibrionaceae bacterium]|nr:methyltransferase domain-containing protein [Pseudobdellovibrionaceae bacterium]